MPLEKHIQKNKTLLSMKETKGNTKTIKREKNPALHTIAFAAHGIPFVKQNVDEDQKALRFNLR